MSRYSETVEQWYQERCTRTTKEPVSGWLLSSVLHADFMAWAEGQGIAEFDLPAATTFGRELSLLAGSKRTAKGSAILGVLLREQGEPSSSPAVLDTKTCCEVMTSLLPHIPSATFQVAGVMKLQEVRKVMTLYGLKPEQMAVVFRQASGVDLDGWKVEAVGIRHKVALWRKTKIEVEPEPEPTWSLKNLAPGPNSPASIPQQPAKTVPFEFAPTTSYKMLAPQRHTCATCTFFEASNNQCRVGKPSIGAEGKAAWPVVDPSDWCGVGDWQDVPSPSLRLVNGDDF